MYEQNKLRYIGNQIKRVYRGNRIVKSKFYWL